MDGCGEMLVNEPLCVTAHSKLRGSSAVYGSCLFAFSAVCIAVLPSAGVSLKRLKSYCLHQLQIFFHNEGARTRCSCRVWFSKIHRKAQSVWCECYSKLTLSVTEKSSHLKQVKKMCVYTHTPPIKKSFHFRFSGQKETINSF